jgi:hypothetical protein
MRKFVLAAFCTVTLVGFVLADEFTAVITKVDGNKITYFKAKAGGGKGGKGGGKGAQKEGDAITGTASASVKVIKGKFDPDAMKMVAGDPIEGGLTNDMFKMIDADMGVTVTLTVADDGADKGKITQIMKGGGKGGGGKAGKGGKGGN